MQPTTRRLAVLTSGGDAPGMNAAIRAITRVAVAHGIEVFGVQRGYHGLGAGELQPLGPRDVSNTIQRGGTILKTSRCEQFKTAAGLERAGAVLKKWRIDGLLAIGGDGTFRGACALADIWPGQLIGLPGTIDNDLYGTDYTIGFDTAVNTAVDAIDKIRDTADSHERSFVIEVMGRHSGFLALAVAIASGAEELVVPEQPFDLPAACRRINEGREHGKTSSIIVVTEGNQAGGAFELSRQLTEQGGLASRVLVLGHLQRGGGPSAFDRTLATKLGAYAVELFQQGKSGVMAGEVSGKLVATSLRDTWEKRKPLDAFLLKVHEEVSL